MAARALHVLIVGGGVGGNSLAIGLRSRGFDVTIAEIDPNWGAIGAGLTLNGATLRAFAKLGVAEEVERGGHIHGGRRVHATDGTVLGDTPAYMPERGDLQAMGGILRPVLHQILSRRSVALGAEIRLGLTVDELVQDASGVEVLFSDGKHERFDLVVGADGISSRIRALVMPEAPAPRFTGQGAWRAVFRRPDDVATNEIYLDAGRKLGLNPVSEREMYLFILENAPENPWRAPETWLDELRGRLGQYGGLPGRLAARLDLDSLINYRPIETIMLPLPWHVGRTALLGDAVHATTPHAGYGAGLAAEDAIILADSLERLPVAEALLDYERIRYARCRAIVEASLELGELEMASAPIAEQVAASAALFALTRQDFAGVLA